MISIHAPIVGCDLRTLPIITLSFLFQSTHPSWGATRGARGNITKLIQISIHAPIVGCDLTAMAY